MVISCEKDHQSIDDDNLVVAMDITDAEYLFTNSQTKLFKSVLHNPDLIPVTFLNAELEPVDTTFNSMKVTDYFKMDENLVCMKGEFELQLDSSNSESVFLKSLLVNLNTGYIYNFQGHYPEPPSYYLGSDVVQKDSNGNLFYLFNSQLFRLSIGEVDNYTVEQYIPDGQQLIDYFIDRSGNCFYTSEHPTEMKIKLSKGGILTTKFLLHSFFYSEFDLLGIYKNKLVQLALDEALDILPIDSFQYDIESFKYLYQSSQGGHSILLQGEVGVSNSGYFGIVYSNGSSEIHRIDLVKDAFNSDLLTVKLINDNYMILASPENDDFVRVDLEDVSEESSGYILGFEKRIGLPTEYDVYSMEVLDINAITISGLRYSDEKSIVAEIDFDGHIEILAESSSERITVLDRIN
jgi:hypothetical protein